MIKGKMNHEAWVHRSRREGSDNETILSTSNTDYVSENTSIARFALNISQSSNFYPLSTFYAHTSYQKTTTKTPNQVDHRLRVRLIIHHQSTHAPTKSRDITYNGNRPLTPVSTAFQAPSNSPHYKHHLPHQPPSSQHSRLQQHNKVSITTSPSTHNPLFQTQHTKQITAYRPHPNLLQ